MEQLNLTPEQINALVDAGLYIVAILFPGVAVYAAAAKKGKDAAIQTLDLLPIDNSEIKRQAHLYGQDRAAAELEKLEAKKAKGGV
nr:hypothetical protein 4 [bacterium]